MGDKLNYSADGLNRLVVKKGFDVYPAEGEFKVEKNNLVFEPSRKSTFTKEIDLPRRIKFEGNWHLSQNHDLNLVLTENDYQIAGDELDIRGKILSIEPDYLIFQAHFKKGPAEDRISLLRLGGRWCADEFNRLNFKITKDEEEDILKFTAGWELNENQMLVYIYEKEDLIRKTKTTEYLEFKGAWQIDAKNQLTYILDLKNDSFFQFKVQLESPDLRGKSGEIKYRIGIGVKELAPGKIISLFGTWKIKERQNLMFEMDYGEGILREIIFGAGVFLDKENEFIFALKNKKGEDLGIELKFERRFLQENARVFMRLSKLEKESFAEVGLKIIW